MQFLSLSLCPFIHVHTLNVFSSLEFNYHLVKKQSIHFIFLYFILPTIPVCIYQSPRRDEFFFFRSTLCNFSILFHVFMYAAAVEEAKKKSIFLKQLNTLFVCISIHVSWHTTKSERKTWQSYLN